MELELDQEILSIVYSLGRNYSIEEFENEVDWKHISEHCVLSENFIREFKNRVYWLHISEYQKLSESFIREFKDKVYWMRISEYQKLSESFIREFKDKVDWNYISQYQKLFEKFIREFKEYVDWDCISTCQKLSEKFMRDFKEHINWRRISGYQKLTETFIREFKDKVYWDKISYCQKLTSEFIEEFKDKIDIEIQLSVNKEKTLEQKTIEVMEYAKKHDLKVENGYLFAFRNHDLAGRGVYGVKSYEKGIYYKDWHVDMRETEDNSFGFGIWPEDKIEVKVKIEDWGVNPLYTKKGRVWGFEMI